MPGTKFIRTFVLQNGVLAVVDMPLLTHGKLNFSATTASWPYYLSEKLVSRHSTSGPLSPVDRIDDPFRRGLVLCSKKGC